MKKYFKKIFPYLVVTLLTFISFKIFTYTTQEATPKNNIESITITDISTFSDKIVDDIDKTLPESKIVSYGYGLRMYDQNKNYFSDELFTVASGTSIKFYASLVNATPTKDSIGFLILIDGILQNYRIDNKNDIYNLFTTDVNEQSLINIPVTIDNPIVQSSSIHTLSLIMIYNFKELPNSKKMFIDFYLNSLHKTLIFADEKNISSIVDVQYVSGIENKMNEFRGNEGGVFLQVENKNKKSRELTLEQGENILIKGIAPIGKYSSIVILNDQIDGQFFWEIGKEGYKLEHNYIVQNSLLPSNLPTSSFVISLPIDPFIPFTFGSTKLKTVIAH